MSRLHSALRTILLEDPAAIESLPRPEASRLAALLEANSLEPLLYRRLKDKGAEETITAERLTAWKLAYVLSVGRTLAFAEALQEIVQVAAQKRIPVRLLRGTHLAFFVYSSPELRPLADLEIQTPPEAAMELQFALRARRFLELESIREDEGTESHCLPLLAREGVTVKVHRRSALRISPAPWDPFSESARQLSRPRLLRVESLLVLLAHDAAHLRFCHSLLRLHDMHVAMTKLPVNWEEAARVATAAGQALEVYLSFQVLRDLLGSPVDGDFLREMEERSGCDSPRRELLLKLARTAVCQYPAPWRLARFVGRLLEEARKRAAAPAC